ncbi:hypothetical protein [Microbacterium thalassium]|uniref:Uncharacterized protein n=1 Tax=Microbacterium thalassium TaxID=362649 RepID=A0A7X0KUN5_9MICO|nr:hypothetical protein [Microbacterium thalassium]MBB6391350.1 hypothetical protein [Microbacterium thalassium]GLK23353.1 hypothetical protein GCM10017607_06710 [Microbacterium thalassium]
MRWERFFDDLEDQLASEWEAERAALDTEAERLRVARMPLRDRLVALRHGGSGERMPVFEFADGDRIAAEVAGVGADWVALRTRSRHPGIVVARLGAIVSIALDHADVLGSARPAGPATRLAERVTFGFALRDLVRRRTPVAVHLATGRVLHGTIDRAGADHLDLALHEPGTARRRSEVTGHTIVGFDAVARVDTHGEPPVL